MVEKLLVVYRECSGSVLQSCGMGMGVGCQTPSSLLVAASLIAAAIELTGENVGEKKNFMKIYVYLFLCCENSGIHFNGNCG